VKILLTGSSGQVGHALQSFLHGLGTIYAPKRDELDLNNPDQIRAVIKKYQPDLIVNPAAFTAVDAAEGNSANAFAINAIAPGILAEEAKKLGAAFIHFLLTMFSTAIWILTTNASMAIEKMISAPRSINTVRVSWPVSKLLSLLDAVI